MLARALAMVGVCVAMQCNELSRHATMACDSAIHCSAIQPQATLKVAGLLSDGATPVRIACIGDSITGVYYHTGGRRAYPEMLEIALRKTFPKAQVSVINAGISGQTTREGLARFERDVLRHKPHLVTVMFGMNDITRVPAAEFEANLKTMIAKCRQIGAEVVLCTQNNVIESAGRPNKKLAEYTQRIRDIAKSENLAVADCHKLYAKQRADDEMEWLGWMSDEIHPNMAGHKKFAEVIAETITGKAVSLADAGPPQPAIPRTLAKVRAGETVRVLAMPPYDQVVGPALQAVAPGAKVEVTSWLVAGKTLAQIEQDAKKVRGMKLDWVIVAVPYAAEAAKPSEFHRSYSWILNSSLSFGLQTWDVIAIPASTERAPAGAKEEQHDRMIRRLIDAQDLSTIRRSADQQAAPLGDLVQAWLREQLKMAK